MYTLHSKFTHAVIYNCVCSSSTHTHIHTVTHHTEPTLTVDNLTVVLNSVQDDMNYVLSYLHIPSSKQEQLQQQYSRGQVNTARADYIIDRHPAPSWTLVANALWYWTAAGALEIVQKLYLKGETCVHSSTCVRVYGGREGPFQTSNFSICISELVISKFAFLKLSLISKSLLPLF